MWYPRRSVMRNCHSLSHFTLGVLLAILPVSFSTTKVVYAAQPGEPVVARVEMKIADEEKVIDVIEKGDLLTVLEEREDDYVILTHDGSRGAVEKVNAVKLAESVDIYSDLIELNPDEGRYLTLRASAWWALGKADKALEDFDRAIEIGYEASHAYSSRGLFHAAMGKFDDAINDYNKALEVDPGEIAPLINRAAAQMSKGEHTEAINDYTLALEKKPDNVSLLRQRAIAWKASGDLDNAIRDFDSILNESENDLAALMGRGYVYFQLGKHNEAIRDFAASVKLNPKDPVAHNNLGYNRFQAGQHKKALTNYNQAIQLSPKYGLALQNRAWLLATTTDKKLRDPEAAVESAKAACELSNYENLSDVSALAAALAAAKNFDKAVGWQEKVVDAVPEAQSAFAKKQLKRYRNELPFSDNPESIDDRIVEVEK